MHSTLTMLAAAGFVALAAPHAAQAAAALDGTLKATCGGYSDGDRPPVECPVDLVKGQDYDFHAEEGSGATVGLVNPAGQTTISFPTPGDGNASVEFRAAYTGTFYIRIG